MELKEQYKKYVNSRNGGTYFGYDNFIEEKYKELKSSLRWVATSNILPKYSGQYLCRVEYTDEFGCIETHIEANWYLMDDECERQWFCRDMDKFYDWNVTHWLPLPPLPEDV